MGFYNGTALELLCQQVVIDNPDVAGVISPDSVFINGPVVARNFDGRNTQATFVGIPGKGLTGEVTLNYDRINLLSFTGQRYFQVEVASKAVTIEDAIPDFNEAFGLNLTPGDFSVPKTPLVGGITFTNLEIAISPTSALFTGKLRIYWRRKAVGIYPNSGPGTKELRIGDEQLGYFGTVTGVLMPTNGDIINGVMAGSGITPPAVGSTVRDWMKFYYKGKVIFIPKSNMSGTTWDNLYKSGSMYSQDDPNYKVNPGTDKVIVEQNKVFAFTSKDEVFYFHHRLPRGSEEIIQVIGTASKTFGEDYELVSKLNNGVWGTETGIVLFGNNWMSQHHVPGAGNESTYIIFNFSGVGAMSMPKTNSYNYVPILELVDPKDALIGVADFRGVYLAPNSPIPAEIEPAVAELLPIVPDAARTIHLTPATLDLSNSDGILPIVPDDVSTLKLTPAVVTVKNTNGKTDLVDSDGELGTFN